MFRSIFRFLASLQFAICLLVVLIAASIVGTILETQFSADLAQKWIYNNWLFNIWLTMLCVNLFCVAAIRYPWKRHQTGFVITHAGIITLLVGSMIDRIWGIEGFMQLHSNKPGTNIMELHEQVFKTTVDGQSAVTNFKVSTLGPRILNSPDSNVKVEVIDVHPVSAGVIAVPAPEGTQGAVPAINYTLQGAMMGRNDSTIFFNKTDNLGKATVVFLEGAPPESSVVAPRLERFYVFLKADKVFITASHGEATGAKPRLIARGGSGSGFDLQLEFEGKTFKFPLKAGESASYSLDGLPDWRIQIKGFYPNFVLGETGRPATKDDNPVNPAAYFDLIGPPVKDTTAADQDDPIRGPNGIAFYLGTDNVLRYLVKSRGKGHGENDGAKAAYKSGEIKIDVPFPVAWAPGAECVVREFMESAQQKLVYSPRPELKSMENPNFGLSCRVSVGPESKTLWVGQSELEDIIPQEIVVGGKKVNFEFVNRTVTLPFVVSLKKFSAPRDEGSNEFAAFESILGFEGRQDTVWLKSDSELSKLRGNTVLTGAILEETADGIKFASSLGDEGWIKRKDVERTEKLTQKISMNRPTTYPISFFAPFFGTNYKFSQASHHILQPGPGEPDRSDYTYSGVQVLRDPGWFFKWFGCIMIVFGIYTMFYLRPYFKRAPDPAKLVLKGKGKAAPAPAPVRLKFFEHPLAVLPMLVLIWPVGVHLLIASRAFKSTVKIALIAATFVAVLFALTRLY